MYFPMAHILTIVELNWPMLQNISKTLVHGLIRNSVVEKKLTINTVLYTCIYIHVNCVHTCAIHVQYMCNTCAIHAQYMHNTCTIHVQYMCNTCMYNTCAIHVHYMYNTCTWINSYLQVDHLRNVIHFRFAMGFIDSMVAKCEIFSSIF